MGFMIRQSVPDLQNQTLKILFVYLQDENGTVWCGDIRLPSLQIISCEVRAKHKLRKSCCLCVSLSVLFFTHLFGTSPLAAELNKLIIPCLIIHTQASLGFFPFLLLGWNLKRGAIRYSLLVGLSLPEATNCHGLEENWLIPPRPFRFTTAPEWRISFQWVLGLCLEKRKQQLLLSQDFLTRGPWKKRRKTFFF